MPQRGTKTCPNDWTNALSRLPDIRTHLDNLPATFRGGIVAIGNFDGVHRGHQAVLASAKNHAKLRKVAMVALTFEPHPRSYFKPDAPLFRLTPLPVKARLLGALGADAVVALPFDKYLAEMSAEMFVRSIICDCLGAVAVVAGFDFHFGKGRSGTPSFLLESGREKGFHALQIEAFSDEAGYIVSSTLVREALSAGDIARATHDLGFRWFVEGVVVHGDKRGRNLGFPTANLQLGGDCTLRHGVYAVRALIAGNWYAGAANYGRRIQFGDGPPLLEIYVMDFSGDLYGQTLRIEFCAFLRDEARFDSVDALVAQMGRDVTAARHAVSQTLAQPRTPLQAQLEG